MVQTGIKKYDKLPSRVGLTDVDALRYYYVINKKKYIKIKIELDNIIKKSLNKKIKGGKK